MLSVHGQRAVHLDVPEGLSKFLQIINGVAWMLLDVLDRLTRLAEEFEPSVQVIVFNLPLAFEILEGLILTPNVMGCEGDN